MDHSSESNSVLGRFDGLRTWGRGDERAPHKPLLVLYALGQWRRGRRDWISFQTIERDLTILLKDFGPWRAAQHPEYPFWRLQSDGVWQVQADRPMESRRSNTDPKRSELRKGNARGRFAPDVLAALAADPNAVDRIAVELLESHFPSSIHQDILAAVGLDLPSMSANRQREAGFRAAVLSAYGYRCAVTAMNLRIGPEPVGLDAAHIKWHQAGGPGGVANGLALSVLHHRLFDRGLFTLSDDLRVLVSEQANGTDGLDEVLLRFHGRPLRLPVQPEDRPQLTFVQWHRELVFRGRPRP